METCALSRTCTARRPTGMKLQQHTNKHDVNKVIDSDVWMIEVLYLSMPAFKHHRECSVAYEVLPAELEFPDCLHLPANLLRADRLLLLLLFGIAADPHDSSSSRPLLRVVKAAGKLKPAVAFHVPPSQRNPPFLCHGSWINRLIGDVLLFFSSILFLTLESRHDALLFLLLLSFFLRCALQVFLKLLPSPDRTTLNLSVGFVCVHVRQRGLRLHQRCCCFFPLPALSEIHCKIFFCVGIVSDLI